MFNKKTDIGPMAVGAATDELNELVAEKMREHNTDRLRAMGMVIAELEAKARAQDSIGQKGAGSTSPRRMY